MPVNSKVIPFTKANVDRSPEEPGVYALLDANENVKYYGMSTVSIRSRLKSHLAGNEGACTQGAVKYKREVTTSAAAPVREAALLSAFQERNGKLPPCNEKAS